MTLDLTIEEVNAILGVLGELPTKHGFYPLVIKIQEQAKAQLPSEDKPSE